MMKQKQQNHNTHAHNPEEALSSQFFLCFPFLFCHFASITLCCSQPLTSDLLLLLLLKNFSLGSADQTVQ